MEKRKLDIEVFSAWNSYAISMMSVLENCGMWKETDSFQKFMSVTGIASQFCVDANCSALPITDYTAFFAGAKQAVQELEQLRERELCLEESEKTLEDQLRTREKAVADTIARTVKARGEEIARSYDAEIGKTEDQLKKVKAKREKARNQGVKGRIAEDTQSLSKENEELKGRIRTLFRANHVPGYCAGGLYYSLYFTRGLKEMGILLLALLIFFLAVPCGIYFAVPERKTWYLILIYLADILIFGGVYVKIGNSTKMNGCPPGGTQHKEPDPGQ